MAAQPTIHLLDVGSAAYGDATLIVSAGRSILVDGAHPADERRGERHADLPGQFEQIFGHAGPYEIDLLVVSHGHLDHIGALPAMVNSGLVQFDWALVADPDLAWAVPGQIARTCAAILRSWRHCERSH